MDQPVLSPNDLAHFADQGFIRVTDALPTSFVARVQTAIWEQLHAQYGIARQEPTTWRPGWCGINKKIIDSAVGTKIAPRLVAAIDQLLGAAQWRPLKTLGGLLLTMPEPEHTPWDPTLDWHFDNDPRVYLGRADELMLFTFFSSVRPRGGGTVVLAGSPRFVERYLAAYTGGNVTDTLPQVEKIASTVQEITAGLAAWHPWLEGIMSNRPSVRRSTATLMEEAVEVEGVPLQIVELTGEPGDAVLCHPALLHAVSMNCSTIPRFMRRTNVRRLKR
jgi:hypothetical protein